MAEFNTMLERHILIALFVPMLVGTGGNAGMQPAVMVVRFLGAGHLDARARNAVVRKECAVTAVTSVVLAAVAFGRVYWSNHGPGELREAAAIGISMFLLTWLAVALGVGFSICLDRMGLDPAAGAAPLLASISDLAGITVLVVVASLFLSSEDGGGGGVEGGDRRLLDWW